jgi:hypothetical protein
MNSYQPLSGPSISIGTLPTDEAMLACELITKAFEKPDHSAERFLREARARLHQRFPDRLDYLKAMRGPIGSILRDLFYRVRAKELKEQGVSDDQLCRFLDNVRFNPLRLLLDRFLEGGLGQNEFASLAGLDKTAVSRILKDLLGDGGGKRPPSLSVARFQNACMRLGIRPVYHADQEDIGLNVTRPLRAQEYRISARERQLYRLVATATRLEDDKRAAKITEIDKDDEVRDFIAFHVLLLYGLEHVQSAEELAAAILEDIRNRPRIKEASQLPTWTELARFAVGAGKGKNPVFFDFMAGSIEEDDGWQKMKSIFDGVIPNLRRIWKDAQQKFYAWNLRKNAPRAWPQITVQSEKIEQISQMNPSGRFLMRRPMTPESLAGAA